MRIREFLTEDISPQEALKNIADILTVQYPALYEQLKMLAENAAKKYDPASGNPFSKVVNFITGSQKSKWYNDVFFKHMKPSLYRLAKSVPRNVKDDLTFFLNNNINDGSFKQIETDLLPTLKNVANEINNPKLKSAVQTAMSAMQAYYAFLKKMEIVAVGDYYNDDSSPVEPKNREPSIISKQNTEVENIINDVLGRIDKRQAGEIRNVIAKSSNKLMALNQELSKRGIKV